MEIIDADGFRVYSEVAKLEINEDLLSILGDDGKSRRFVEHDSMDYQVQDMLKMARFLSNSSGAEDTATDRLFAGLSYIKPFIFRQISPHLEFSQTHDLKDKDLPGFNLPFEFRVNEQVKELLEISRANWSYSLPWLKSALDFVNGNLEIKLSGGEIDPTKYAMEKRNKVAHVNEKLKAVDNYVGLVYYGSVAEGTASENSDIDMTIFLRDDRRTFLSIVHEDHGEKIILSDIVSFPEMRDIVGSCLSSAEMGDVIYLPIGEMILQQTVRSFIDQDDNCEVAWEYLRKIFHKSVGSELLEYRSMAVSLFGNDDESWSRFVEKYRRYTVCQYIDQMPVGVEDKRYFPETLEEAKNW